MNFIGLLLVLVERFYSFSGVCMEAHLIGIIIYGIIKYVI